MMNMYHVITMLWIALHTDLIIDGFKDLTTNKLFVHATLLHPENMDAVSRVMTLSIRLNCAF